MFRKKREVKQLSAEELRIKLYSHFDKTGSLNRMRTELRGKLVSELLKVTTPVKASVTDEVFADFEKSLLPLQVTNWLVYDHLLRQGHQYALSIFVTETGLAPPEKLLTACDILCLFGLDSTTPEYKNISKMYSTDNKNGCSYSLLLAVIKSLFDFSNREERHATMEVFDKELADAHPKELLHKLSPKHILENEQKMQFSNANLDAESLKFRKQSMSKEDLFCGRNISAESNLSEHLQLVMEENKRENQNLRQKLLQELDRLHAQERSQQLEMEHERLLLRKEHDVLLAEKEKLKEKDHLLTKEYENKLERKIRELETDFTTKMYAKEKSVEDLQRKLFEKEQRLVQIEVDLSSQHASFNILKKELEDMQNMHKTIHEKYSALLNDNTNLLKKFESMSDYAVVKSELEAKSHQVSNLHRDIGDITKISEKEKGALTEIIRNLETKLNGKDSELMETQRQLNLTRDNLHMKEAVWTKEKRKLEQENLASKDMYRTFSQKLEEQKGDIQALHQTIHLLHYQLTEKNTIGSSTSEPFTNQRAVFTIPKGPSNEPEFFRISRHFKESPPKYKESSLKFIEDAKNKIFKLQQQEDELQDKCSIVYSSVPEFNNPFLTNHLAFNATSTHPNAIVTEPTKRFSPNLNGNFKNLIGNEMPTLDLSFPANIKNSLASTFTDIYTPQVLKTLENATNIESTSNVPTSAIFNSSHKKVVTSTDIHLKNTEYVGDKCNYNAQDTEDLAPQISNLKDPLESNKAEYPNTKGTISKNLTSNNSIKTSETQVRTLDKFTLDISNLEKEKTATEKRFSPVNFQEKKAMFPDPKLLASIVQRGESKYTSDSVSAFDSERLKPDLTKQQSEDLISKCVDLSYDKVSKSVSKVTEDLASKTTEDSVPKDTSHSESVIDVPIVVDLDAVWKRKSSLLPVDSPSQHKILVKQQTSEQSTEHKTIPNTPLLDLPGTKITSPNSNSKECSENETDNQNVSDGLDVGLRHEGEDVTATQKESSKEVQIDTESENPNLPQNILKYDAQKQDILTSEFIHKDSSRPIDAESIKKVVSEIKTVHEDSLSELSEIHLSCGSEQEQQKEDSDNW